MDNAKKVDRVEMLSGNKLVKESFKDIESAYCNKKSVYPCLYYIANDLIVTYADVIILLHKDMPANKNKGKVEALVAKNRNSALGVVLSYFAYQYVRFKERTQQMEQTASEMH